MVAFVVGDTGRVSSQLWVRSLDSPVARRLDDGDGTGLPFWSPDSRRIGFFSVDKLKIVAAAGGRPEVIADAPAPRGGSWSRANVIVFAPDAGGPLYRVSPNGGEPTPVTALDPARNEYGHRFPAFLPDGEHFLFAALPGRGGRFDVFAGSLRDRSRTRVGSMESSPVYAEPGWLLFARQGVLVAQPFDAGRRQVTGEAVSLEDEPASIFDPAFSFTASHSTSVSSAGSLAYFSAPSAETIPTWLDASGKVTGTLNVPAARYSTVRISPEGTRAVLVRSTSPTESSLWLADLARGGATRLSSGPGLNESPVWSPDGTRVVLASDRDGAQDLFVKAVGDASPEQPLYRSGLAFKSPDGWSPDGRWIVFQQLDPDTQQNIWLLPTSGNPTPTPYVRSPARDRGGWPSPDGRWLAYLSEDSGRSELYVQPFPVPGRKVQVSTEGAIAAWWTHDGRHILFLSTDRQRLWRVDVEPGAMPRLGEPKPAATLPAGLVGLDAMPDRQRWLALVPEREGIGSVTIVQNWRAALAGKRPLEP
jgi:Tol biopolymer transport system component